MRMRALAPALLLLAGACGGASAGAAGPTERGDADAAPAIVTLPSLDVPEGDLSEKMRFAFVLADEALSLPMPPAPVAESSADLAEWMRTDLERWLERKSHTVDSARRELDVAAEESHRQRIVAGAVVGLLYEDVARALLEIPMPPELVSEPEIADMFREVRRSQAAPFLEHARRAYRACAANAAGGAEPMAHWSPYCGRRLDRLPE